MNHLQLAFKGNNQWWRYILVLLISFIVGGIIGGLPLGIFLIVKGINLKSGEDITSLSSYGVDSNLALALMIFQFIAILFIFLLLIKPFHKRSYLTLFSGNSTIRWKRVFTGAFILFGLNVLLFIIGYLINPEDLTFNFHADSFFILVLVSITLIPFQAAFEEVVFRGYLAQGVGSLTKNRILVILIPSILFGLLHYANPEIKEYGFWLMMPQYILFGVVLALVTVLDDGIELAIGAHAANNIFASVFVTYKSAALQTEALFIANKINPIEDLISFIIIACIFVFIASKMYKFDFSVLTGKIKHL